MNVCYEDEEEADLKWLGCLLLLLAWLLMTVLLVLGLTVQV